MDIKEATLIEEGDFEISNNNLFTDNLYSCVALYAITNQHNYLAHILVEDESSEFYLTGVDKVNKLYDFLSEIENKNESIYVGLVYGVWKNPSLLSRYEEISTELETKIEMLKNDGFNIEILDDVQSEFVFVNFKGKELIFENESINLNDYWNYNESKKL